MWGSSAQGLDYRLALADGTTFANLNFALLSRTDAVVRNLYERVLVRPAEQAGFAGWTANLNNFSLSPGQALEGFLNSSEYGTFVAPLAKMIGAFAKGQPVDGSALAQQAYQLRNAVQLARAGVTPDAVALDLLYSQPFVARFGDTSQQTNQQFVTFLYQQLLNRAPDPSGLAGWTGALSAGTLNRGQVILGLIAAPEFAQVNVPVLNAVTVNAAYLGLLGRVPDAGGFQGWVNYLAAGGTVVGLGNAFVASPEFASLRGYDDLMLDDMQAQQQARPPVQPLTRLRQYNPATQAFDTAVTAGGVTGAGAKNVYFIAHGWAPGYAEDVLLRSTPGNPLTWWGTLDFPGGFNPVAPYSDWLFTGVDRVSVEGLAQAVVDADPNAVVIAYSWMDASATPGSGAFDLSNLPTLESAVPLANQSEAFTQNSGLRLAQAVQQALGADFFANKGLIHLMGHSHGAKVAAVAALALQNAGVAASQLTTFESPEWGPVVVTPLHIPGVDGLQNFTWYYLQQMNLSRSPVDANRTPQVGPGGRPVTFVDNYWSTTGFGMFLAGYPGLGDVVDVQLNPTVLYPDFPADLFPSHDYPLPWYAQASLQASSPVAGLGFSPLLNPAAAQNLSAGYLQGWTSPVFSQQFNLIATGSPLPVTPQFDPGLVAFAEQARQGLVSVGGSSITLAVDAGNPTSLLTLTFTPDAALGAQGQVGTGMEFTFQFQNAQPGDRLVFWARGMLSLTINPNNPDHLMEDTGKLGYRTVPLFIMDAGSAGPAAHKATVSLDSFVNNPNALVFGALHTTQLPQFGFSLVRSGTSTGSVTVSNMRQFNDGTGIL